MRSYRVKAALMRWFIDGKLSPRHNATRTCWWKLELRGQKLRNTSRGLLVIAIDRICPWGPQREHNPLSVLTHTSEPWAVLVSNGPTCGSLVAALNISAPFQGISARLEEREKMGWQTWAPWGTKPGSFEKEVPAPHPRLGEEQGHKADLASKFLAASAWVLGHSLLEKVALWAGKGPC